MEPLIGRHEQTNRLPIEFYRLLALRPFEDKALAGENQNMCPRLVAMRFLISSNRKLGHMERHAVAAHLELHVASVAAAGIVVELVEGAHIGDEVRFEHLLANDFSLAAKVVCFAVVSVVKNEIIIKNKIFVVHQVDHRGSEAAAQ